MKGFQGPSVQQPPNPPQLHPCWEFPTYTEAELKYFTNKRKLYECKYLDDCLYNCFDNV